MAVGCLISSCDITFQVLLVYSHVWESNSHQSSFKRLPSLPFSSCGIYDNQQGTKNQSTDAEALSFRAKRSPKVNLKMMAGHSLETTQAIHALLPTYHYFPRIHYIANMYRRLEFSYVNSRSKAQGQPAPNSQQLPLQNGCILLLPDVVRKGHETSPTVVPLLSD